VIEKIFLHCMHLQFDTSKEALFCSIEITKDSLTFLNEHHYNHYFPSALSGDDDAQMLEQISRDQQEFFYEQRASALKAAWDKIKPLINQIFSSKNEFELLSRTGSYVCRVTMYGPSGYFEEPNIVYVNITIGNEEFWMETVLYEILHLWIDQKEKDLPHEQREEYIDSMFLSLFGEMFPNYKK